MSLAKIILFTVMFSTIATSLPGQQYVLQVGDRLEITFWQEPDLNTTPVVAQNGTVEIPVAGRIQAAGFTASELSQRIIDEISRYRIKITQASVVINEYQGNKIYVTGQVGTPGTYSFEVIPNLWRVLQEAGGLSETANLEKISVIRESEGSGDILQVDLTRYFERGDVAQLPELRGGDTIHVPTRPSVSSPVDVSSPFAQKNEIYIAGEVVSPGRYNLERNIDLWDAIILAGGPTPSANLSDVKILKRKEGENGMMKINLKEYLDRSEPEPPILVPGDKIFIPRRSSTGLFILTRILIPVITATAVTLIVRSLVN